MIVDAPFKNGVEIGKDLVNFVRYLSDDANLLRISDARKDSSDSTGVK
jgi:hypothetical protein